MHIIFNIGKAVILFVDELQYCIDGLDVKFLNAFYFFFFIQPVGFTKFFSCLPNTFTIFTQLFFFCQYFVQALYFFPALCLHVCSNFFRNLFISGKFFCKSIIIINGAQSIFQ